MKYSALINNREYRAELDLNTESPRWFLNGQTVDAVMQRIAGGRYLLKLDGRVYQVFLQKDDNRYIVFLAGQKYEFSLEDEKAELIKELFRNEQQTKRIRQIQAPMPGLIISLPVQEGQDVHKGDTVAIIEAMKMENEIKAATDGTIKQILVSESESVDKNAVLLTIE